MYDTIIIGAGPAGLTAAIYTGRKKLKTLVISLNIGGQCNWTSSIENYPGVEAMPGYELMNHFENQAKKSGVEFIDGKVVKIEKKCKFFLIKTEEKDFEAKTLILTIGRVPRSLNVPGEDEFMGKGVHTCTTCDAPLYGGKTVAMIGGGNSALDGTLELSHIGVDKVYLIHRRNEFRADETIIEKIKKDKKIEILTPYEPVEIKGQKFVESFVIKNTENSQTKEIRVDGIFVEIGSVVDTGPIKDLVKINERNEIIIDANGGTSQPGVFAAGDATSVKYKQVIIAAGDGAKAALEAYTYLTGGKSLGLDWGK